MIYATNTALYERPESFNGLGMHIPAYIDTLSVPDAVMLITGLLERIVNRVFVRVDRGLGKHVLFDLRHDRRALDIRHSHSHNASLALHHPQHGSLVRSIHTRTPFATVAARPANIGFVYLDWIPASESTVILQHQLYLK